MSENKQTLAEVHAQWINKNKYSSIDPLLTAIQSNPEIGKAAHISPGCLLVVFKDDSAVILAEKSELVIATEVNKELREVLLNNKVVAKQDASNVLGVREIIEKPRRYFSHFS